MRFKWICPRKVTRDLGWCSIPSPIWWNTCDWTSWRKSGMRRAWLSWFQIISASYRKVFPENKPPQNWWRPMYFLGSRRFVRAPRCGSHEVLLCHPQNRQMRVKKEDVESARESLGHLWCILGYVWTGRWELERIVNMSRWGCKIGCHMMSYGIWWFIQLNWVD